MFSFTYLLKFSFPKVPLDFSDPYQLVPHLNTQPYLHLLVSPELCIALEHALDCYLMSSQYTWSASSQALNQRLGLNLDPASY